MKKLKKIPAFKSEDEERNFGAKADTTKYFDITKAKKKKFPNLKPSLITISIRLPKFLLEDLKTIANKKDVPYQSLMKIFLAEKVRTENSG
jgi:predicted DNA binding CopG/RHH family protein